MWWNQVFRMQSIDTVAAAERPIDSKKKKKKNYSCYSVKLRQAVSAMSGAEQNHFKWEARNNLMMHLPIPR